MLQLISWFYRTIIGNGALKTASTFVDTPVVKSARTSLVDDGAVVVKCAGIFNIPGRIYNDIASQPDKYYILINFHSDVYKRQAGDIQCRLVA